MLIRGGLTMLDRSRLEVYVFTLSPKLSYWGTNVSKEVEHFILLEDMNTYDSAEVIASYNIDILIDLNGHTLHTGLQVMSHQPAHIQMSYLGLPTSTGAPFIDHYIGKRNRVFVYNTTTRYCMHYIYALFMRVYVLFIYVSYSLVVLINLCVVYDT